MENSIVRQRYARRPAAARRRRKAPRTGGGTLRLIIARQLVICVLLLVMIAVIKSINISPANFVTDKVKYALSHDVELKNVFSYVEKLAVDIKNSIVPASDKATDLTEPQNSIDTSTSSGALTLSTTPASITDPAAADVSGTVIASALGDNTATLSSEESVQDEGPAAIDSEDSREQENSLENKVEDAAGEQTTDTVEASSSIDSATEPEDNGYFGEDVSTGRKTSVLAASTESASEHVAGMLVPVEGTLSSLYGEKTYTAAGTEKIHKGIDINVKKSGSVRAALDGKVADMGTSPAYGSYIRIIHAEGLQTVYANCSSFLTQKGAIVKKGDVIASIGDKAASAGVHLHFEVWRDGDAVDPLQYISVPAR